MQRPAEAAHPQPRRRGACAPADAARRARVEPRLARRARAHRLPAPGRDVRAARRSRSSSRSWPTSEGPLDAWAVLDALGTLVDRSLVTVLAETTSRAKPASHATGCSSRRACSRSSSCAPRARRRRCAAATRARWRRRSTPRGTSAGAAASGFSDGRAASCRMRTTRATRSRWARAAGEPATAVAIAATLVHGAADVVARRTHGTGRPLRVAGRAGRLAAAAAARLGVAVRPMLHRQQQQSLARPTKPWRWRANSIAQAQRPMAAVPGAQLWIRAAAVVSHPPADALREALAELARWRIRAGPRNG